VETPSGLASSIVGVALVLVERAVFCLGQVYKDVEGEAETMTVLAIRMLPVFPWLDPARSSAGNLE